MSAEKVTAVQAIRRYFGNVTIPEMKALTLAERHELGQLAVAELGLEIQADVAQ